MCTCVRGYKYASTCLLKPEEDALWCYWVVMWLYHCLLTTSPSSHSACHSRHSSHLFELSSGIINYSYGNIQVQGHPRNWMTPHNTRVLVWWEKSKKKIKKRKARVDQEMSHLCQLLLRILYILGVYFFHSQRTLVLVRVLVLQGVTMTNASLIKKNI